VSLTLAPDAAERLGESAKKCRFWEEQKAVPLLGVEHHCPYPNDNLIT
jgi:hypothetical protein